jgi:hypothetical protein
MRAGVLTALLLLPAALVAQNADLHVMPIRGNVFMLIGAGSNVTVSAGVDGVLVVDAGSAAMADKTLAVISEIDRATSEPGRLTTCVGPACYQPGSLGPFTPFGWAGSVLQRGHRVAETAEADSMDSSDDRRSGAHGRHCQARGRR